MAKKQLTAEKIFADFPAIKELWVDEKGQHYFAPPKGGKKGLKRITRNDAKKQNVKNNS